jgi:hypothetical protein
MWWCHSYGGHGEAGPFVSPSTPASAPPSRRSQSGWWTRQGPLAPPGAPTAVAPAGRFLTASRGVADHNTGDHNNGYEDKCADHSDDAGSSVYLMDPFPYDERDVTESVAASDMDWNGSRDDDVRDALLSGILLKPSEDDGDCLNHGSHPFTTTDDPRGTGRHDTIPCALTSRVMALRLATVRDTIRGAILESPAPNRAALVSVLVHWARTVATDPLAEPLRDREVSPPEHNRTLLGRPRRDDGNNLYSHNDATSITAV